ncbi:MAG TPA: flagellar protein FlgN [Acidobacteriota bacterium]|nr:flagellar protein FlgN [Acidobacteriota bacterium]
MDSRISDILRIVRDEIEIYRDLVEHARRKTALLVQGRLDAILESNKVEETFNIKLRILETEMTRLCSDLCRILRIPREEFTLLKLADGAEQPIASEIKSQTNLFKNLIDQLKSVNQRNMRLVENSIHYSRGLLDFFSNATSSYQKTGLFKPYAAVQRTFSHQA